MLRIVNGTEITTKLVTKSMITSLNPKIKRIKKKGVPNMKNYMKTMVESYFMNNLVALLHVGNEDAPEEVLKRNSYTLLNISPRFF